MTYLPGSALAPAASDRVEFISQILPGRYLRDALCGRVHPPQEDTVLLASGRRVLGV